MPIQFERQSLYEEVWSESLTRLGKKYGLSDNGVRKVCIALNIPLPKAGHWAKIAAGHQIPRTPLPENSKITVYVSRPKPAEPSNQENTEDAIWLEQRETFESAPANHIAVELQPKKFHPLLLETRSQLIEKVKESEKLIIEAQKEAIRPKKKTWEPNINSFRLSFFERNGQLLELHRWSMPLRLTPKTWERGLAIMSALFIAAEKRGFEITKEKESNRLSFKLDGEEVYIRMSEKLRQEIRASKDTTELNSHLDSQKIKVPTGILRFHICLGGYTELEIPETSGKPLQDNLNQVFFRIYKLVVRSRVKSREWAEWRRKRDEEDRQREEIEKIRLEALRLQELESQKRKELLKDANDWQSAELICKYVDHLDQVIFQENSEGIAMNQNYQEWRDWAINSAEQLDPTAKTLMKLK